MFVERNKNVVALADALIVVQGREGSGTLHTVKFAVGAENSHLCSARGFG